jgi:hypothetical protein
MDAAGLTFRPYYWLSDEWFTPDGVPGIAIPFYLGHPRLAKLEFAQMLEVEGRRPRRVHADSPARVGHAIDNRLRAAAAAAAATACSVTRGIEYPEYYTPKPYSKSYVQHLDHWYAQSHPDEDFARDVRRLARPELHVGEPLRRLAGAAEAGVHGSPDAELARARPRVSSKRRMDPLPRLKKTLGEHYGRSASTTGSITRFLRQRSRQSVLERTGVREESVAARFVRRIRREVRSTVASFTDSYQYTIDQLIETIIDRCRELNLS